VNRTTRLPAALCLHCRQPLDAATDAVGDNRPSPGDATICMYCGTIAVFADDMTLREPNREEARDLAGDPRVLRVQRARKLMGPLQ
jgi:hypothetical protein